MDRVAAMILKTTSIREVTAFPKNRSAFCPLTQAPAEVAYEQLAELGLLDIRGKEGFPGTSHQKDRIDHLSWVSRIGIRDGERPAIQSAMKPPTMASGCPSITSNSCRKELNWLASTM